MTIPSISRFSFLLSIATFLSVASAQIYDISIPPQGDDSYEYADFRIVINDSLETIRGVYFFMHPWHGDSRNIVNDDMLKALCDSSGFALMGAHFDNMHMETGSGDAIHDAMNGFVEMTGRTELSFAPFFINGYSWGGQFAYHYTVWNPERVVGFITQKGGYHDTTDAGDAIEVPGLMFVGEEDLDYRITNLTRIFLDHRPFGAKWSLAVEQGAGHSQVLDWDFLNSFFIKSIELRLPDSAHSSHPVDLLSLPDSIAWFGDQDSWTIGSSECFDGIVDSSSWFPSRNVGDEWQNFVSEGTITDTSECENLVWHISTTGSDSIGNGSEENPFASIQHGIDISANSDTVLVAPGTYVENINFNGKNIVVGSYTLTTGDTTYINQTVIDGDNNGTVVSFVNEEDSTAILMGLTLTHGLGFDEMDYNGGGILILNSNPKLMFLNIRDNSGTLGGGIFCENSSPMILNTQIFDNSSVIGGGICLTNNSNAKIKNIIILNNIAASDAASAGGGIYIEDSSPIIENFNISNNYAYVVGGGIYCRGECSPIIKQGTISYNTAYINSIGGGIFCWYDTNLKVRNTTIVYNSANYGGAIGSQSASNNITIINSILWGNESLNSSSNLQIYDYNDIHQIFYSNIQDSLYGESNISINPRFIDTTDFRLQEESPCIDVGTPFFVWGGDTLVNMAEGEYSGNAPDMGAFESPYTFAVAIDHDNILIEFGLQHPFPNPFNPTTTIRFNIPVETQLIASLRIYDITGRLVETLVDRKMEPGNHEIIWNASNQPSGIYFVVLHSKNFRQSQKLILLK